MPATPDFEFIDGFDKYDHTEYYTGVYQLARTLMSQGEWSFVDGSIYLDVALGSSAAGRGLALGNGNNIQKYVYGSYARLIGGCYHKLGVSTASRNTLISCNNTGVANLSLSIQASTGDLCLHLGTNAGTILATAAGVAPSPSVHCIEWDLCPHNTLGYARVWVDGILVINYTGDTANTATNGYDTMLIAASVNQFSYIDHFYSWHYLSTVNTGETPALTNPYIETSYGYTETQSDFTVGQMMYPSELGQLSNDVVTSNAVLYRKITPTENCTLNSIVFIPSSTTPTASTRAMLYADTAGSPSGSPLATSADKTGLVNNANSFYAISYALVGGTSYWLAIHLGAISQNVANTAVSGGKTQTATFTAGAPVAGSFTSDVNQYRIAALTTGTATEKDILNMKPPRDLAYVQSGTVNAQDLYKFTPLSLTPTAIYSVALKARLMRTDTGVRTVALKSVSNGATVTGPTFAPAGTPQYQQQMFSKNPDGLIPWTKATLDAADFGYKVIS